MNQKKKKRKKKSPLNGKYALIKRPPSCKNTSVNLNSKLTKNPTYIVRKIIVWLVAAWKQNQHNPKALISV